MMVPYKCMLCKYWILWVRRLRFFLLVLTDEPRPHSWCISFHCLLDHLVSRSSLVTVDSVSLDHLWVKITSLFYLVTLFDLSCAWTSSQLANYTLADCRYIAISNQYTEGRWWIFLLTLIYKNLFVNMFTFIIFNINVANILF